MSPPSSAKASAMASKTMHSRNTTTITAAPPPGKAPSPKPASLPAKPAVHYTCFVRLPFPRGDFVDPPAVEWDTIKDKALWKLISKTNNSKELDWETIAARFSVDLPFLLQQAAWLYERHFEGMRKQMQKLGVSQAPSPVPSESAKASTVAAGAKPASKDSRMPSVINTLKAQPNVAGSSDGSSPGTPKGTKPTISRTPSTTTVTQSRLLAGSGLRSRPTRGQRGSSDPSRKRTLTGRPAADHDDEPALGHDGPSESDSEDEPSMARSQAFRRGPLGKKPALRALSSDGDAEDGEDDSSGGYLPFAAASKPSKDDPSATLKDVTRWQGAPKAEPPPPTTRAPIPPTDSSTTSSASSAAQQATDAQRPGPISPRHRAQLARVKEGSEGSPSMGSSFSDLDDASVTRSDLEEALMSRMQRGSAFSIGSRLGIGGGAGKGRQG